MSAVLCACACVCACVCAVYKEAWRVCCVIIVSVRALPNRSTHSAVTVTVLFEDRAEIYL